MAQKYDHIPIRSFEQLSAVRTFIDEKKENLIIDFDDLSYIRFMKLFQPTEKNGEKDFYESIILDDFSKETTAKILKEKILEPFHLRFYIPKSVILRKTEKIKKLVIMFNGLNESKDFLLYDMMGECFANNEIAAVLLPTPLHLNRKLTDINNQAHIPTKENSINYRLFYYNVIKSWYELQELIGKITNKNDYWAKNEEQSSEEDFNFYKNYFGFKKDKKQDIEISLLGYSLGGLRSLTFFLNDQKKGVDKIFGSEFHSCITINTCPNIKDADILSLNIGKTKWDNALLETKGFVEEEIKKKQSKIDILDDDDEEKERIKKSIILDEIFLDLYFAAERDSDLDRMSDKEKANARGKDQYSLSSIFKERLESNLHKYLAIVSGSDQIVKNTAQIDKIASRQKSIHKITVAGVKHNPDKDPNWQDFLPRVERNIIDFINSCNDRHYNKNEILAQLSLLLFHNNYFEDKLIKVFINEPKRVREEIQKQLIESDNEHLKTYLKLEYEKINFDDNEMKSLLSNFNESVHYKERFLKYYYLSKAFFPHFSQVIKAIHAEFYDINGDKLNDKKVLKSLITFEILKLYFIDKIDAKMFKEYRVLVESFKPLLKFIKTEKLEFKTLENCNNEEDFKKQKYYPLYSQLSSIDISSEQIDSLLNNK